MVRPGRDGNHAGVEPVKITLTVEDAQGGLTYVTATGPDYDTALAAAKEKIPEESRAIVIRTERSEA